MKVSFFSNFLNHHQLPFCREMFRLLGGNFLFIATEKIPQDRLELGYEDMNHKDSYVIRSYESVEQKKKALKAGINSDVVIIGSAPDFFIEDRLKKNKLTFRYSERIFKNGYIHVFDPRNILGMWQNHTKYRNKNLRMLCASGYTAYDMNLFMAYPNKMYKWGYFPQVLEYDIDQLIAKKSDEVVDILWVGRFIKFKHPEQIIKVANYLKARKVKFIINMIGIGDLKADIESLIKKNHLEKYIYLRGAMRPEEVRGYMEKAEIFLFTSDFGEGWGAVLNEAMNSGCAVVVSHAIGSSLFLVSHMDNGVIYQYGNDEDLNKKVFMLCENAELRKRLGKNAYKTLQLKWTPHNAAINFCKLSESLLSGNELAILEGPGSQADVVPPKRAYGYMIRGEIGSSKKLMKNRCKTL